MFRSKAVRKTSRLMMLLLGTSLLVACVSSEGGAHSEDDEAPVVIQASTAVSKPNVIVILTDDQGYADVGFNGSTEIPTPHIDRIANEGVRFDQGYVSFPVCGPSRAGLLTGRYQSRFGFDLNPSENPDDPRAGLPVSEKTFAEVLSPAGYTSMISGKWHMGLHPDFHPNNRGFDEFYGFLNGGHNYFTSKLRDLDPRKVRASSQLYQDLLMRNDKKIVTDGYLTDLLSDEAANFIDDNKDQPFFLFLSYNAPHVPMHASKKYLDRFPNIKDDKRRTYAAMVSAVDDGVGQVLNRLDVHGIADNTMVFFLSDNGGPLKRAVNASSNAPFQGGKGTMFEGGVRVPFAMRWPDKVKAGIDYPHPVSSLDILSTAVAGSGVDTTGNKPLDGVDLVPFLNQQDFEDMPHDQLFWRYRDNTENKYDYIAVLEGETKYIRRNRGEMLFNLENDLGEENNLRKGNNDRMRELSDDHKEWSKEMIDVDISIFNEWPVKGKTADPVMK